MSVWAGAGVGPAEVEVRQIALMFLFDYCVVQVVNVLLGRPLNRLVERIAAYGERKPEPYKPSAYTEGNWQ